MIRPICRMGNPILRVVAREIAASEIISDELDQLITDLRDSMKHYGGIGIAAPQIGVSQQVCVIEMLGINRYGKEINLPFTVFINPKIEGLGADEEGYWEGCLSVPGLRGFVERPQHIRVIENLSHKYFSISLVQASPAKAIPALRYLSMILWCLISSLLP